MYWRCHSILHFAKAGLILVLQQGLGHIWGTIGSVLTPGSILDRRRSRFPALISMGGANRFLEDLISSTPKKWVFGNIIEAKDVQEVKLGCFHMCLHIQDHLGQVQSQRQPKVGPEQGCPQVLISGQCCCNKSCSACKMDCFWMFPDTQDHLGQVKNQRQPGVGWEQGCPQGLIFGQCCYNKSCSAWETGWLSGFWGHQRESRPVPGPNTRTEAGTIS